MAGRDHSLQPTLRIWAFISLKPPGDFTQSDTVRSVFKGLLHSSLWVDKGLGEVRGNGGPHQTLQSRREIVCEDYGQEGVGASPGDENLTWAYSAPNPKTVAGVPKN